MNFVSKERLVGLVFTCLLLLATGQAAAAPGFITSPAPGSTLTNTSQAFSWTAGGGASGYILRVGTTVGGSNIYQSPQVTTLTATATNLPTNGSTLYVRLSTLTGSSWANRDYTYKAVTANAASMSSPANNATFGGSSQAFSWTAGTLVSSYQLSIGNTVGASDIFQSTPSTNRNVTASGLPTDGRALYVRLSSQIAGNWQSRDYTYTAVTHAKAVMVSPTPGSILASSSATFTWTTGSKVTSYKLDLGTSPGGTNIHAGVSSPNTSLTVNTIPASGPVYARLWSTIENQPQYNDYTYSAGQQSAAQLTTPTANTSFTSTSVAFAWSAGNGATSYQLSIGSAAGGTDIYNQNQGTGVGTIVTGLPNDGRELFVRLTTNFGATSEFTDYTFHAMVPPKKLDLKVLVVSADGLEVDLDLIKLSLQQIGVSYEVYIANQTPGGLTAAKLAQDDHAFYNGIILVTGSVTLNGTSTSALTPEEFTALANFEEKFGVRQVSWYVYPNAELGYQVPNNATGDDVIVHPTADAAQVFTYIPSTANINIHLSYTYLALPLTDGNTKPLLVDASGNAIAAIRKYSDNRETLSMTTVTATYLRHSFVVAYGVIDWVTKGLFFGQRHVYSNPHVDDVFLETILWAPNNGNNGPQVRMTGADFDQVVAWQQGLGGILSGFRFHMAFNGYGITAGANPPSPDTLLQSAQANKGLFEWISHTYDHEDMSTMPYAEANQEALLNQQSAVTIGLTAPGVDYNPSVLVTPAVSGLTNANAMQGIFDAGIRYVVSDTSHPEQNNPSPNVGLANALVPGLYQIPRHPSNLYFNVGTPELWVAEYNSIYHNILGFDRTYQEILEVESDNLVNYMIKGDLDPLMFHQLNLVRYDGTHTLLTDLLDMTFNKYKALFNLPVRSPNMADTGQMMKDRATFNASGVTATYTQPNGALTATLEIHTTNAAKIPVTGLNTDTSATVTSETYGGEKITTVQMSAGETVTLPAH